MTVAVSPRDPHRVALGVARRWRFPSASAPGLVHVVSLGGDGGWECSPCLGFEHGRRADGLCRHVDMAREETRAPDLLSLLAGAA